MRLPHVLLASALALTATLHGAPKPVPQMQAIPLPRAEVSFQREGREVARYLFGPELQRPFLFPVVGPSGRALTRMGHPHDPESHSHHNSVWVAHQNVDGQNFWEDAPGNRIVHQRVLRFADSDQESSVETENAWTTKEGAKVLREFRRIAVRPLDGGESFITVEMQFEAPGEKPVTLGQTSFGFLGVRMAKTIGVNDGGGTIRNSEGGQDEEGCFRKPARWCDYSGPIASDATEGITLMDHPGNVNHPIPYHVRNDGWMGTATSFPSTVTIEPGKPLRERYGLYVHAGGFDAERIEKQWEQFARSAFVPFKTKR